MDPAVNRSHVRIERVKSALRIYIPVNQRSSDSRMFAVRNN